MRSACIIADNAQGLDSCEDSSRKCSPLDEVDPPSMRPRGQRRRRPLTPAALSPPSVQKPQSALVSNSRAKPDGIRENSCRVFAAPASRSSTEMVGSSLKLSISLVSHVLHRSFETYREAKTHPHAPPPTMITSNAFSSATDALLAAMGSTGVPAFDRSLSPACQDGPRTARTSAERYRIPHTARSATTNVGPRTEAERSRSSRGR